MFRIDKADQRQRTSLIIDGELVREYVEIAERCCREVLEKGRELQVVLRDVSLIDVRGKDWLQGLIKEGIPVISRDLYASYIVGELRVKEPTARPE